MEYFKRVNERFDFFNILYRAIVVFVIFIIFDYYEIIDSFSDYKFLFICGCILVVSFGLIEIIKKRLLKFITIETINYFDKLLFILFVAISLFLVYCLIVHNSWVVIIYIIVTLLLIVLLIVIRLMIIKKVIKESVYKNPKIYNIYDLYKGNVHDNNLVLLEENAILSSKKDLLDVQLFVTSLKDILINCFPKETYIIALIGKWGCGKTSIINILEESLENNVVMAKFSPWKYNDKLSLFTGFYDLVFKSLGNNIGYVNYKKIFNKYKSIIFGLVKKGLNLSIDDFWEEENVNDIDNIRDSINEYISLNKKKLIIVIDDIDRLDKNQILLIFKLIKTVFNFDNLIYILCFDEERINKLFEEELNIDSCYLDKIIQNKIIVPKIDNNLLKDIGKTCIINIINNYNINVYDDDRLNKTMDLIFKNLHNLRDVIRLINSISVAIKCLKVINLDISDIISLEYIKYSDINLYYQLSNKSKYLISEDSYYNLEYEFELPEKFNKEAEEVFGLLFKGKENIMEILANVFPNVEKYSKKQSIRDSYYLPQIDKRQQSILTKRCYNGRYFNIYFNNRHNVFTIVDNLVTKFINNINNNSILEEEMAKLKENVDLNNYDILFELLDLRMGEINDLDKIFNYFIAMIDKYQGEEKKINTKILILISTIIKLSPDKAIDYIELISKKDLMLFEEIVYWLTPDKYLVDKQQEEFYHYGMELLRKRLDTLIETNYKLYDKKNYRRNFSYIFFRNYEDNESKEKSKKYITSQLNKYNVFRILGDCLSEYIGGINSFQYNNNNAEAILDTSYLEKIINSVDYELNKDQLIVKELYDNRDKDVRKAVSIDFSNL